MKKGRTLVCGDIHGGLKSLRQVIDRCEYDYDTDKLIFLGDYVDGWSESRGVIDYLIELKDKSKNKPIFIRGNHDYWLEKFIESKSFTKSKDPQANLLWINQRGRSTVESYGGTIYGNMKLRFNKGNSVCFVKNIDIPESHINFFKGMINFYIDSNNIGFVHGGYKSDTQLLGNDSDYKDYFWDTNLWQKALMYDNNISKHKELYIGHISTCLYKCKPHYPEYQDDRQVKNGNITIPMKRGNVWNIDTGGAYLGKLTILDINTKEFWQSDKLSSLYSDEFKR